MPHVDTPSSLCQAGVARADITPPVGIYHRMWGAATHDRSTGIHRPLLATILVLRASEAVGESQAEDGELVLAAVDHCILWPAEMAALLDEVASAAKIPQQNLLVAFSHTHSAGLMGRERAGLPGGDLIAPYLSELARKLSAAVTQARATVQSAVITYGMGRCALAGHRDMWDEANQRWVCGFNPDGPADDALLVARITDSSDRTIATVVNYACHPTTLAWDNTLLSPDYVGAMRELVESATDAPCVFLQGASGDLGPRHGYVGDTKVADSNGRQLGHAVMATYEGLPPPLSIFRYQGPVISGAVIGTWDYVPLEQSAKSGKVRWRHRHWTVDLPFRKGLPTIESLENDRARLRSKEQAARDAGEQQRARDLRAQVEVLSRQLVRMSGRPPGSSFPFSIHAWQLGDVFWVAVEAEHYQLLQRTLRDRAKGALVVVATVINGSLPTYLPVRAAYGTGIYQETIALLAPGCLERLIDEIAAQIDAWRD